MPNFESEEYKIYLKDQVDDNWSGDYDERYFALVKERYPEFFDVSKDTKVLDIGTRSFGGYQWWKDNHGVEAVAIDVGREGLDYCKEKGLPCIELDAHRLKEKFENNSLHRITAFHSFEHMYDLPHVIRNCTDCLKSGGYLLSAVPIPSFNWRRGHWYDIPSEQAYMKLMEDNGLEVKWHILLRNNEIRPQPEVIVVAKKP